MSLLMGCDREEPTSLVTRSHEEPLLIGLIPEQDIFKQLERYRPLANYMAERIGRPIEMKVLTRYGNLVDNFISLKMDGAFFGSFTYALAHEKLGVQVLARPESLHGSSTYHGYIFVRKESGIKTSGDMAGKRFVFVDKATTAGYLLPLVFFKNNGIDDYRDYFAETYFAGTHEDAVYDVLYGRADIGAAKNTVFQRVAGIDSSVKEDLVILFSSPDVPENGLAVRRDLDDAVQRTIKETLLEMKDDPDGQRILREFGATRFIETWDTDYEPVFDYAAQVGLDLSSYDYIND